MNQAQPGPEPKTVLPGPSQCRRLTLINTAAAICGRRHSCKRAHPEGDIEVGLGLISNMKTFCDAS